jgi:hypothetical protein
VQVFGNETTMTTPLAESPCVASAHRTVATHTVATAAPRVDAALLRLSDAAMHVPVDGRPNVSQTAARPSGALLAAQRVRARPARASRAAPRVPARAPTRRASRRSAACCVPAIT